MSEANIIDQKPVADVQAPFKGPVWGGWPIPQGVTMAYGARAIYTIQTHKRQRGRGFSEEWRATISRLWDRQDFVMVGDDEDAKKAFCKWIDKIAIPTLEKKCVEESLMTSSRDVITFASDGYSIIAGPRASYGYLYITAWKVPSHV